MAPSKGKPGKGSRSDSKDEAAASKERRAKAHAEHAREDGVRSLRFADAELVQWMQAKPEELIAQRKECLRLLAKRRCSYGRTGGSLPLTLTPAILTREAVTQIAKATETLDRALDKVVVAYGSDPYVRAQFPYPDIPTAWIDWDPGYPKPTVISRHDAIFDGKNLKFVEFNTDNPGARAWADVYEEVYRAMPMYHDLLHKRTVPYDRRQMAAIHALFERYWARYGSGPAKPRVALSTFKEYLPGSEWEILRDYLIERGMEANFVDSREFEYAKGRLTSGRVPFQILHLCLRFVFFKRFPREHKDFFDAIRDRAVLTINHFRAAIGSEKEVMAFMTNPEHFRYFDADEVEAIRQHLPWTRRMDETVTISPDGRDVAIVDYALKNRETLVLKITTGAGGHDVYVGKACEEGKWRSAVESTAGCPWWILQEAVEIPQFDIPVLKDNKVVLEKKNVNLNPYVFDGKYCGAIARVSDSKVINVAAGGGIMPVFEQAAARPSRA